MSPAVVAEYLARLLTKADEDAFHSLIEEGDQSVEAIRLVLQTCTEEQCKPLIEVLQEIRTDHSRAILASLCKQPYSKQWVMAAEGLFYNNPTEARAVLVSLLAEADENSEQTKAALIEDLFSSESSPTPDSPP